jgi:hypothetical protein
MRPGTRLYSGRIVGTAEDAIVNRINQFLLEEVRGDKGLLTDHAGRPKRISNARRNEIHASVNALLYALQAVRAGSDYFTDDTYLLRTQMLGEVIRRFEEGGAA